MVIHQNVVVWDQVYQKHRAAIFAMQGIFASIAKYASENFASLAKFYRDRENGNFAINSEFR